MNTDKYELSVNELMILQSALRDAEKSLAIGYLMLLGGHLGVHRFYLKRYGTAVAQLVLFLAATACYVLAAVFSEVDELGAASLTFIVLMLMTGGALFVWIVVDLFLIPRMIRQWNERAEREIIARIRELRERTPRPEAPSSPGS